MVYTAWINSEGTPFQILLANMNNCLSLENEKIIQNFCQILGIPLEVRQIQSELKLDFSFEKNLVGYSRIYLMDTLSHDFVWLDADLLLLPGWTQIFYELGDDDNPKVCFRAAKDTNTTIEFLKASNSNQAYLRAKDRYFNSGVMKISPTVWQREVDEFHWQEIALRRKSLGFNYNDQDVLNFLAIGKISILDPRFNHIPGSDTGMFSQPLIKHFAGYPKPWKLSKKGKELLMATQGANYFRTQHSTTKNKDSFLEYPSYWMAESKLESFLSARDPELFQKILSVKMQNLDHVDVASRIKLMIIKFFSRRFR
jgi:lipopolysaccharide biosynthesis glycosyltransferase